MVAVLGYSREEIATAVREMYAAVASRPETAFHFPVGRRGLEVAGYPEELLVGLPEAAVASFAGVGCPFRAAVPDPGERVLDVGSGAGVDSLIAARLVGPTGVVYALDMTPAMTEKLRLTVAQSGLRNVAVLDATADKIPLDDSSVDLIISNGVLNLVPEKRRAIREMFRVLVPGGRMQIADIVISLPVTPDCLGDPKLWAECVVGATVDEDFREMFRDAGFEDIETIRRYDYFAHSPSEETREVARSFDASAIELRMRRADAAPRLSRTLARRFSPGRLIRRLRRRGAWGVAALVLALTACYGMALAVGGLALFGVTAKLHEGAWAAGIVALAAFTTLVVGMGIRKHKRLWPSLWAAAGLLTIGYAMAVSYHWLVELAGFAFLAIGVFGDYRVRLNAASPRKRSRTAGEAASSAPANSGTPTDSGVNDHHTYGKEKVHDRT